MNDSVPTTNGILSVGQYRDHTTLPNFNLVRLKTLLIHLGKLLLHQAKSTFYILQRHLEKGSTTGFFFY